MPEWYLFTGALIFIASLGFLWAPLLWVWVLVAVSFTIVVIQAVVSASKNISLTAELRRSIKYKSLISLLHIIQPIARLYGRIKHGLTPWRKKSTVSEKKHLFLVHSKTFMLWSEDWKMAGEWLELIEKKLLQLKTRVRRGGEFDRWDIQIGNGLFSTSKGLLAIEEHGANKQYLKFRCKAGYSAFSLTLIILFASLSIAAIVDKQWIVGVVFAAMMFKIIAKCVVEKSSSFNTLYYAFDQLSKKTEEPKFKVVDISAGEKDVVAKQTDASLNRHNNILRKAEALNFVQPVNETLKRERAK